MKIYDQDESYSILDFSDMDVKDIMDLKISLVDALSCYVEGYKFMPQYRAGTFDGKKYFFDVLPDGNMRIPKGLVQSIIKLFRKHITEEYQPLRKPEYVSTEEIEQFVETLDLPFPPRSYQIEAVVKTINDARKICVMCTSSGKSMTIYILLRYFMSKGMKGILIVPNVGLVEQMFGDFKEYNFKNIDDFVHVIYAGKDKNFDKPITVTTWQSGMRMHEDNFAGLDYVFIDEAHLAKGDSLTALINASKNCLYKVGFTGTLPKVHADRFTLSATLGKSEKIITAQGLIDLGFATPVSIISMYLNYPEEEKKIVKKLKYQQEVKYIEEHYRRNNFIAKLAVHSTKMYGNTLLLYNTLSHGEFLLKLVLQNKFGLSNVQVLEKITKMRLEKALELDPEKLFTLTPLTPKDKKLITKYMSKEEMEEKFDTLSNYNIFIIKGDIDGETRNKIRALIEAVDDAILIASFGTVSTGVSIKRLHNIFLCSSTASSIRLLQSVGRGMRQHKDKSVVRLFDFIDDFSKKLKNGKMQNKNHVLKHSFNRLDDYIEQGFPIKEKEVDI